MPPLPQCEPWSERELLNSEKESLGFYVTGHPLQRYEREIRAHADTTTTALAEASSRRDVAVAGMIIGIRDLKTRKGERMAVVQFEDMEGQAEAVVFPAAYKRCYECLQPESVVLLRGRPEAGEDSARMIASQVTPLVDVAQVAESERAHTVEIAVDLDQAAPDLPSALCAVLEGHRGSIPVRVYLRRDEPTAFRACVHPNRYLFVDPTNGLLEELERLLGAGCVRLRT